LILIGLTGGPGAGKSLAAKYLADKGAAIISGDRIGKEVLDSHPATLRKIAGTFGQKYINPDGSLDRSGLARLVFGNPAALKKLNAIIHPPLLRMLKSRIRQYEKSQTSGMVVVDAALIFEWGIEDWFDQILVITAKRTLRIDRMMRAGLTREEAENRIASQIPQRAKAARADSLIENNGAKIALRNKVYGYFAGLRR
jgi:dephospho-CoA kinase